MAAAKPCCCPQQQEATRSTPPALQWPAAYPASGPDPSGTLHGNCSESSLGILGTLFPPSRSLWAPPCLILCLHPCLELLCLRRQTCPLPLNHTTIPFLHSSVSAAFPQPRHGLERGRGVEGASWVKFFHQATEWPHLCRLAPVWQPQHPCMHNVHSKIIFWLSA